MPILRKPKHENFTMVRNYFINDTRLKPDGKGVLLFMLSKPDDWNFKYENLMVGLGIEANESIDYDELNDRIFDKAIELGADQLTFRKLFTSGDNVQTDWINENKVDDEFFVKVKEYIKKNGELIGVLPYGYNQYNVRGISVVVDEDCMNEEKAIKDASKYFVLRQDCKLYDGWNKSDIIF